MLSGVQGTGVKRDDPSIWSVAVTELARMRAGFLAWYTILAPIIITVPLYLGSLFSPEAASGQTWQVFRNVTLECWGVLVPVTAALTAALSVRADHESWRLLLSYAVPRWRFFVGKFCGLATLGFVSSTVLLVMISGGAALNGQLGHDFWAIVASAYLPWLAGLAMTALALLVAVMWGLGPAIAIGVIGMLSGALVSDKTFWYAIPFAWPMRVILPLAGIGPNGIPLPPGSPLADAGVIPFALVLSAGLAAVLMVLGGVHLTRKEI